MNPRTRHQTLGQRLTKLRRAVSALEAAAEDWPTYSAHAGAVEEALEVARFAVEAVEADVRAMGLGELQ